MVIKGMKLWRCIQGWLNNALPTVAVELTDMILGE
jgi:hypothetical protein